MEAFSEGVRLGGLYDTQEIKILICYMLNGVKEPLPREAIVEILFSYEIANLFETSAAIDDLVHLGNLKEDAEGRLTMTESGEQAARQLFTIVPYTLREQALGAAMQLVARTRNEQNTRVTIEKLELGYAVTCAIDNSPQPMMSFTLRVADRMQAERIREQFLNDPLTVYRMMVSVLTGSATVSQENGQTVLRMRM